MYFKERYIFRGGSPLADEDPMLQAFQGIHTTPRSAAMDSPRMHGAEVGDAETELRAIMANDPLTLLEAARDIKAGRQRPTPPG